ncbi:homoserine kinase [Thiotrichales bacterium 19S11-10]|nr:homoserine kinase [Thiotrichales bacterium 19S11-10]
MQNVEINTDIKLVKAFAPASSANFLVGFDLIGFPISGVGDEVTLIKRDDQKLNIVEITGVDAKLLSDDMSKNVVTIVIEQFIRKYQLNIGFDIYLTKGITIGSGMGGSAASAVAAMIAVNSFLKTPLLVEDLLDDAIYGESIVSGGAYHGDNIAPSMLGGLVLLQSSKPVKTLKLPSCELYAAVVCPKMQIETKMARTLLKEPFELDLVVKQSAALAAVIAALYKNDKSLLKSHLDDILIEPRRKHLIEGFDQVKSKAMNEGALGCGISGSGPSMFALAENKFKANKIAQAMKDEFLALGVDASHWVTSLEADGAKVIEKT